MDKDSTEKVLQLSRLEAQRDEKRQRMHDLFAQQELIKQQMVAVEEDLSRLDSDIEKLEFSISRQPQAEVSPPIKQELAAVSLAQTDGRLKDTTAQMTQHPEEVIPDPLTQMETDNYHQDPQQLQQSLYRPPSRASSVGPLELSTKTSRKKKDPPSDSSTASLVHQRSVAEAPRKQTGRLDDFLVPTSTASLVARIPERTSFATTNNNNYNTTSSSAKFPWTDQVNYLLTKTFRIPSFRGDQKEIIDATLAGEDVFVIMRTGGGKSLTYQLPSLVEGRGPQRKVTFVISPLLSLIQDQEEQMNQFAPGSALSFTSGLKGGNSEHARRWGLVRDPEQQVCLVFVTPEKVSKSNKLCGEMEKLFAQGRLGRFVIDECHCACQWGHDFRPDYALLGKLKSHFPSIPVIAVTATASDRVREDVCKILRLGANCRLFRSTANRPNITYSVRPKPDGKGAVVGEMAAFIKEKHPRSAGIVYAYSRKDANTVAADLRDAGISAEAYHSEVSATKKEKVHKSWMRNKTQVVVATIAFGLGINKPDVRFVLHHSISKTLEAYYQESGRAGRDGNPADCVLYYSPKDVIRVLKMVHGSASENLLWPMVRYAQQSGNDEVCRTIIMKHLGEPNCPDPLEVSRRNSGITTERRDVGKHAKTAVQVLYTRLNEGNDMTLSMLVKEWRAKGEKSLQCVKDNPPASDGLRNEDCERIIIALLLEGIIRVTPKWTKYDTIIYVALGNNGERLLRSQEPKIVMDLPIVSEKTTTATRKSSAAKQAGARKSIAKDGNWLSTKPKAARAKKAPAKKAAAKKAKPTKKKKATKTKVAAKKKKTASKAATKSSSEIIELLSDDEMEDDSKPSPLGTLDGNVDEQLWEDEESASEYEFDG